MIVPETKRSPSKLIAGSEEVLSDEQSSDTKAQKIQSAQSQKKKKKTSPSDIHLLLYNMNCTWKE